MIGSCSLTSSVSNLVKFEKEGAGAAVLKSLFEENIAWEMAGAGDGADHPEAYDYLFNTVGSKLVSDYLDLIREAKTKCTIPVIASVACHSDGKWTEYARQIEEAGADALELNVMSLSTGKNDEYGTVERLHADIVKHVCGTVRIPVIVKLGSNLSNPVALANALYARGARGVVLFNRFYPTDIDVERMDFTMKNPFTTGADISLPIRWAGILSAALPQLPVAVSGGVHDWQGVAKALLSGACAVEIASAVIKNGAEWIGQTLSGLEDWLMRKDFSDILSCKGKMNATDPDHADRLLRTQFLKYFGGIH